MTQPRGATLYVMVGMVVVILALVASLAFVVRERRTSADTKPLVVALTGIPQGTVFKEGQTLDPFFAVKQVPASLVPFGSYSSVQQIVSMLHHAECLPKGSPDCTRDIVTRETIYQDVPVVAGMLTTVPYGLGGVSHASYRPPPRTLCKRRTGLSAKRRV